MSLFMHKTSDVVQTGPGRPTGTGPVEARQLDEAPPDYPDAGDSGWEAPPRPTRHEAVPVYQVGAEPGNLPYVEWDGLTTAVVAAAPPVMVGALNRRRRMIRVRNLDQVNVVVIKRNPTDNDSVGVELPPGALFELEATCEVYVSSVAGARVTVYAEYDIEEYDLS